MPHRPPQASQAYTTGPTGLPQARQEHHRRVRKVHMPTLKAFEGRDRPFFMQFFFCQTSNILLILDISKDPFGIARLWDVVTRKPLP
jgi:hypothetical protein